MNMARSPLFVKMIPKVHPSQGAATCELIRQVLVTLSTTPIGWSSMSSFPIPAPRTPAETEPSMQLWGMVATPFLPGGAVDESSLRTLARTLLDRGCTSLVCLGVLAEPASLSATEKIEVLAAVSEEAGSAPVVATVMSLDRTAAVEEAREFTDTLEGRISAIMVPVSHSDDHTFRENLRAVHAASGLPLIIQDLPKATGVRIETAALIKAVDGLEFVQAIKCEAEPTFERIRHLASRVNCRLVGGFGGIGLVDDLRAGATGMAAGISRPEVLAQAIHQWQSGDERGASSLIAGISGLINLETQQGPSIAIRKEHWRRQGVIEHAGVRPPTIPWSAAFDAHSRFYGFNQA